MEMPTSHKLLTLVIIQRDHQVLLGMKKRGWGAGRWNGFGGKVEKNESIEAAAKREVSEECGIHEIDLEKMGTVVFEFEDGTQSAEAHIFRSSRFGGMPTESEEMRPQWFNTNDLPWEQMWPSDTYWLPLVLAGKKFKGSFLYDRPSTKDYMNKIIRKKLEEVQVIN